MLAYGYPFDSDIEMPEVLCETSLLFTREELDSIISFLEMIRDEYKNYADVTGIHRHFRDFDKTWNKEHSDLIVCLTNQKHKQNI